MVCRGSVADCAVLSIPCQASRMKYPRQAMYTIKETAARTSVPVSLLRAWERRYGIVAPLRTPAGYRLYDDAAIDRLRTMRRLVDDGWSPSIAAAAIVHGEVPSEPTETGLPAER